MIFSVRKGKKIVILFSIFKRLLFAGGLVVMTLPKHFFSAQFNGGEMRQSSPSPSSDRRRQLRAPGGGFKPIKHGSPEFCGILGERVDPTVPLEKQM